jgi:hypothetical protein
VSAWTEGARDVVIVTDAGSVGQAITQRVRAGELTPPKERIS